MYAASRSGTDSSSAPRSSLVRITRLSPRFPPRTTNCRPINTSPKHWKLSRSSTEMNGASRTRLLLLAASLAVVVLVAALAARSGLAPARVYQDAAESYRREVLGHEPAPWVLGETKLAGLAELEGVQADTARALAGAGY